MLAVLASSILAIAHAAEDASETSAKEGAAENQWNHVFLLVVAALVASAVLYVISEVTAPPSTKSKAKAAKAQPAESGTKASDDAKATSAQKPQRTRSSSAKRPRKPAAAATRQSPRKRAVPTRFVPNN